ncbi:MAG: Wzz/FepE/Etk N-terminal domain-containing protein [Eubacteriales bacterium]
MEENNQYTGGGGITFRQLLLIIRANIFLIVAIIVIATIVGVVYSTTRKTTYTATRSMIVICKNVSDENDNNIYNDLTATSRMIPTIAEYCKQEVVLSLAQEIYGKSNSGEIKKSGVKVSYDESGNNYFLYISYTDVEPDLARAKVMAVSEAEKEIVETVDAKGNPVYVRMMTTLTFVDTIDTAEDLQKIPCVMNSGSKMIVVLAVIIGIAVPVYYSDIFWTIPQDKGRTRARDGPYSPFWAI